MNRLLSSYSRYMVFVLHLLVACARFDASPCSEKKLRVEAGQNEVFSCGNTECPKSVKTHAYTLTLEQLPFRCSVAYLRNGDLYLIETANDQGPKKVSHTAYGRVSFSGDGRWVLFNKGRMVNVLNGKTIDVLPPNSLGVSWWESSHLWASGVAWISRERLLGGQVVVWAREVVFGDSVVFGQPRVVAYMPAHTTFFSIAGSYVFIQGRRDDAGCMGARILKLTEVGVTKPKQFKTKNPLYPAACGLSISPSGRLTVANYGHGYQDCYPDNHKGFAVIPSDECNDCSLDWMSTDGVSVNWCPVESGGENLREGTHKESEFQFYNWTNHEDWICCIHRGEKTKVFGVWLVNWKTNTWCLLTDPELEVTSAAVHIEDP